MITINGKYNHANVMIDAIDETTREQIQSFADHPNMAEGNIVVMPDCHAGKGAVVGFTMPLSSIVIPNIIGVDIGCGMLMNVVEDFEDFNLEQLDEFIKAHIPAGFNSNQVLEDHGYLITEVTETCNRLGLDAEKALKAVGSLGGGNHFIEAGTDSQGKICLTIHSGSRNFGKCVADYYQKLAGPNDLDGLSMDDGNAHDYLHDMAVAQRFASRSRKVMMKRITDFFDMTILEEIESVHNFIGEDDMIRKGATSAKLGEKLIVPFNMRDGLALCVGKGNPYWNYSAPHGAGRILSRSQAKKRLSVDKFHDQMTGIYTTTANIDTLDESPDAYKDMNTILGAIGDTVDVIDMIKPIYNLKASKG
jgi:tRNA-splicing ligase RtcB